MVPSAKFEDKQMVKFIHTADWQIGMKAAHVGAVGKRVRSERLESAKRVVELAPRRQADFIIVTGDTFDDNAVDRVLVQKVADILGSLIGPVYLIVGNRDPLISGFVWEHPAWASHPNLHVIAEAKPIELDAATLYPCPLFEKYSLSDPTAWIDAATNPKISIGIGHGTVEGISQAEPNYSIPRDAATGSGLDYLGIGHWHSYSAYPSADGIVRMAYSGTHETTKFGERDSGNVLLVETAERASAPVLESIPTGGLRWTVIEESLTDVGDAERVREQIESLPNANKAFVNLKIGGILHHEDQTEQVRIEELMRARFLYGPIDTSNLASSPSDESWLAAIPGGVMQSLIDPIRTRANSILQRIAGSRFDGLEFDDTLLPTSIAPQSNSESVALNQTSGGEQEQVHFAVRMALADIAFPDSRQLVVLDDVFTYTDSTRLGRVATILEESAQRFQIVLLTCHPERYRGMSNAEFFDLERIVSPTKGKSK